MEAVGLTPAATMLSKYPYELSGGQRQRIGFAQALALRPKLILADEPVSMLDVSIRVGVLNMMADLRAREGVSILYITHDLASARYVADRVIVMYAGHVVEVGPTEQLLAAPRHPYTKLLLSAVPDPQGSLDEADTSDAGEAPKVVNPAPGCRFNRAAPSPSRSAAASRRSSARLLPPNLRPATWPWPRWGPAAGAPNRPLSPWAPDEG